MDIPGDSVASQLLNQSNNPPSPTVAIPCTTCRCRMSLLDLSAMADSNATAYAVHISHNICTVEQCMIR